MAVIRNKDDDPDAIRYNTLETLQFPVVTLAANQVAGTVQAVIPIGVAYKIQALIAVITGTVAGSCSLQIASGVGALAGVGTPDNRGLGTVPPTVATNGQQLFSSNQAMTMTANLVQSFYPTSDLWDMIFGPVTLISLRTITGGATTGNLSVSLLACPVNIFYNLPDTMHPYAPSATML
jgi:hypothetical protein